MARRRRSHRWTSEAALAAQVVAYLRRQSWRVFQEIAGADIVARDAAGELWVIECKRTWSLAVLAQADRHRDGCHRCSIAVPAAFPGRDERFGQRVAKAFGIGIVTVAKPDAAGRSRVREALRPVRRPSHDGRFDRWLVDRAEDHAAAGSPSAAAWTPFKETVARLQDHLRQQAGGCHLTAACRAIEHHYASPAVAAASLRRVLDERDDLGLRVWKQDGRWWVGYAVPSA